MTGISFPPTSTTSVYLSRGAALGSAVGTAITAATTRYVSITGQAAANATIGNVQTKATRAATALRWEVRALAPTGTGDMTGQLTVNGVVQGDVLTWTAGSGETTKAGETDVVIAAGDLLAIKFVNANALQDGTFYAARIELV